MGKIKLSLIVFVELTLFIFCSEANAQSNEFNELKKAAADMIYDIAHGAISHFDIISPEETSLVFRNPRAAKRLKEDLSNKQNIQDMLSENKNDGIEAGMDWNDVTITDIRYKAEYCTDFGAEEIKGYIS